MSIKRKTLQLIQRRLKGTQLCKDVLVVLPTQHILRGFLFERTLSKDMYYLWRVVTPLYKPANPVFLTYSKRLSKGGYLRLTREALDETAERIASIMSPGHLSYLRRVRGPKEFLKHVGWMAGNTMLNFRVDLALTHYLLGNVDQCIRILTACREGVNPGGKLLVVDNVIQPGNDFSPGKFLDLQMLIFPGGCERTEKEFRDLFAAAGWRLSRIIPTAAADSIVEGIPA